MNIKYDVAVNENDFNDIIFCAFRYALGRQTYITGMVGDLIKEYKYYLSKDCKELMIKEINWAIENNRAGSDIDIEEWLDVLHELS